MILSLALEDGEMSLPAGIGRVLGRYLDFVDDRTPGQGARHSSRCEFVHRQLQHQPGMFPSAAPAPERHLIIALVEIMTPI